MAQRNYPVLNRLGYSMYWHDMWDNVKTYSYHWHLYTTSIYCLKKSLDSNHIQDLILFKNNFLTLDNNLKNYEYNQEEISTEKDLLHTLKQKLIFSPIFGRTSLFSYQNWIIFKIFIFIPLTFIDKKINPNLMKKTLSYNTYTDQNKQNLKTLNFFYFLSFNCIGKINVSKLKNNKQNKFINLF